MRNGRCAYSRGETSAVAVIECAGALYAKLNRLVERKMRSGNRVARRWNRMGRWYVLCRTERRFSQRRGERGGWLMELASAISAPLRELPLAGANVGEVFEAVGNDFSAE